MLIALSSTLVSATAQAAEPAAETAEKVAQVEAGVQPGTPDNANQAAEMQATGDQTTQTPANPTQPVKTRFYVIGGLGASQVHTPDEELFVLPTNGSRSYERGGLGGKFGAGYRINRNFGVEANYLYYATSEYKAGNNTASTSASLKYSVRALDFVVKGYFPIEGTRFDLFGFLGGAYVMGKTDYKNDGSISLIPSMVQLSTGASNHHALRGVIGFGGEYRIPKMMLSAGVEFTYIDGRSDVKGDASGIPSTKLLSAILRYRFK